MRRIFESLLRAYSLRRTRLELYALSDHMLHDIGLRRDEIQGLRVKADAPVPGASRATQ